MRTDAMWHKKVGPGETVRIVIPIIYVVPRVNYGGGSLAFGNDRYITGLVTGPRVSAQYACAVQGTLRGELVHHPWNHFTHIH